MKTYTKNINVPALAEQITLTMNGWGWRSIQGYNDETVDTQRAHLVDALGMEISLYHDTYKKRLVISPCYPRSKENTLYPYNGRVESITVSPDRDASAIAKDISRRLLPEFITTYQEGLKQLAEHNAYVDGQRVLWEKLCKLSGDAYGLEHKREFTAHSNSALIQSSVHYDARVNGPDSVTFDRFSVNAAQAEAIIKLLSK